MLVEKNMKIVGYKAILNNGTVIDKNTKVGEELDWLTPHRSHTRL